MAVYRCNQCGLIAEETSFPEGSKIPCETCSTKVTLFPTAFYLKKLFDRYQAVSRELGALRRQEDESDLTEDQEQSHDQQEPTQFHSMLRENLQNTMLLATPEQHRPLEEWFASRKIKSQCDYVQVDTTGFFDEAAILIGEHYALLSPPLNQIRYGYNQGMSWLNIPLGKHSQKEKQTLKATLRQLYGYTFFARYNFQKTKDVVGLALQPAQPVQSFLTGGWLEWWAFIRILECCLDKEIEFSCARSMTIEFEDKEKRELDVVFLLKKGKQSCMVIVECKTGEFRAELKKYRSLQKRLKLDDAQFVICSPEFDEEQGAGLTAMYGLTFVNLENFTLHLNTLFKPLRS